MRKRSRRRKRSTVWTMIKMKQKQLVSEISSRKGSRDAADGVFEGWVRWCKGRNCTCARSNTRKWGNGQGFEGR